jgi:hypothetical protein
LDQLSVDISQFCQLVVPHMAGVQELVLRGCRDLSAADLIALTDALTAAGVRLSAFEFALRDNIDGSDAVAALCRAQPSLERLCIAEFDDSHYHKTTQQRYALIAAIIGAAEPSALRRVSLTGTPVPMPFDVWWCDSSAKMDAIRFSFWDSSRFATLSAHIESRSGKPQPARWYADELTV